MLIVFSPLWRGTRISRSSRPASSMSSWRKSSSMRPATRRARIGRRRSIFTTRASGPWKCQKSRHQWKNEKTVQPKLYRSLFPHDVFLSGAAFRMVSFLGDSYVGPNPLGSIARQFHAQAWQRYVISQPSDNTKIQTITFLFIKYKHPLPNFFWNDIIKSISSVHNYVIQRCN